MEQANRGWLQLVILLLVIEKIIQHVFVTAAFALDWRGIRATVAVPPDVLLVLGAIVALLFMLALWGLIRRRLWAVNLALALALFDMVAELVAQGRLAIQLNVSFLVASTLLVLCLAYRRQSLPAQRVESHG